MQNIYILYVKNTLYIIILYNIILYVGKIIVIFLVINHFHWNTFLKLKLLF